MEIDTSNEHIVCANGDSVIIMRPPGAPLARVDALRLAAWIVAIADDGTEPTFEQVRRAVENT